MSRASENRVAQTGEALEWIATRGHGGRAVLTA